MSKNQGIDKQSVIYPYNGILVTNTKERATNRHNEMDEFQNYYAV